MEKFVGCSGCERIYIAMHKTHFILRPALINQHFSKQIRQSPILQSNYGNGFGCHNLFLAVLIIYF